MASENKPNAIGTVVRQIVSMEGSRVLLNTQSTLGLFMDLAPKMQREKELLRAFLQVNGAEMLIHIESQSAGEQKNIMEQLVGRLMNMYLTEDAARYVCAGVYYGITGREWQYGAMVQLASGQPKSLDLYANTSVRNPGKSANRNITVTVEGKTISVTLPGNVTNGQTVRFAGKGKIDPRTGNTGDLYVTVHIASAVVSWQKVALILAALAVGIGLWRLFRPDAAPTTDPYDGGGVSVRDEGPVVSHVHSWRDATCTAPKTCTVCGETSGSRADHSWREATCTAPQTCTVCGETSGSRANHSWREATNSAPRTCTVCGETQGLSLGTPLLNCRVAGDSQSEKETDLEYGTIKDVSGTKWEDAIQFWVNDGPGYVNVEHIIFDLSGRYDQMNFVIALSAKSERSAAVRFYIYADGKLLERTDYISGTTTQEYEINVSGVRELKIECETDERCQSYGLFVATLYVG